MEIFNWIKANHPHSRELIFSPAGFGQVHNGKPHLYTGVTRKNHFDHVHWAMAKGGVATEPTKALIAEAGFNEAVVPLNAGGMEMLADAMDRHLTHTTEAMVTRLQSRELVAAGGVTYVTYSSDSYTYDHSMTVEKVELRAETPREMFTALEGEARRANLTRPPQQRGRRG
jgi:hypothetical protein